MRATYEQIHTTVIFEEDLPDGGARVRCGRCGTSIDLHAPIVVDNTMELCPTCRIELLYPGWAEW